MRNITLLLLSVSLLGLAPSAGADGMLDPSFGNGGIVLTDIYTPNQPSGATAVMVLPDGRAVAVGSGSNLAFGFMAAVRYLPSGALDPSFGNGGIASHSGGPFPNGAVAEDGFLQPDGRLVLFGTYFNFQGQRSFALVRLTDSGASDPTFGTNGYVNGPAGMAVAGVLQPDGRIVAAGNPGSQPSHLIAARCDANGSPDLTFGVGGVVTLSLAQGITVRDVALQPDGKLVIGGLYSSGAGDFIVVRLLPNGAVDPSFDGDGVATSDFGGAESGYSVIVQPDGRIVLAGSRDGDFALVRYLPDGSLDTTFGTGGLATAGSGVPEHAEDVILLPNGKLLVAGFTSETANEDFELARFHPDGVLDTSFGTAGLLRTDVGNYDECYAVSLAGPDLVLTAGTRKDSASPFPASSSIALARYIATTPVELLSFEVE